MESNNQYLKELLAGGAAGTFGVFFGIPFDLVKVRMQSYPTKFLTPVHCFTSTIQNEGFTTLFRGALSPLSTQIGINAILFATENIVFKILKPNLTPEDRAKASHIHFLSGMVGGIAQCVILVPADVVKCKMQADIAYTDITSATNKRPVRKYSGTVDCSVKIFKSEGLRGFSRGFGATALREVPSIGAYFSVYHFLREKFSSLENFFFNTNINKLRSPSSIQSTSPSVLSTIFAGGFAGCACWALVYPLDVIKTNIQISTESSKELLSIKNVAKTLYRKGGLPSLFVGFTPTMARAFSVNGIVFICYEFIKIELML